MAGKLDPLLAALINKLPPADKPWPWPAREAWLQMVTCAFDVVYGCEERPAEEARHLGAVGSSGHLQAAPSSAVAPSPPARVAHAGHEFYVSVDGTVCNADATPVMMIDVPPEEMIFDYRPVTGEFRDLDSIVWADGARGRAGLAEGVSFCGPG